MLMTQPTQSRPADRYRVYQMSRHGRPVLATPVQPLALRKAGLMRMQPTTPRRAVYRRVMGLFMNLGIDQWFARDADSPVDPGTGFDFNAWLEQARTDLGDPNAAASVLWPSQPDRMRMYVHLLSASAQPIGFAKISLCEESDRRLAHEADILNRLTAMDLKECHVPRVLANAQLGGHRYLILEPIPEDAVPMPKVLELYPRACVEEFAGPTRSVPADQVTSLSWWKSYQSQLKPAHRLFAQELEDLIADGVRVRLAHGDFGSHNIVTVAGKLWVFDWEEACDDAPAITDETLFWLTVHYLATRDDPRTWAGNFARTFLHGASRARRCDAMMVLAFWLALKMPTSDWLLSVWECTREIDR